MSESTVQADKAIYSPLAADSDLREIVEMYVGEMPERIASIERLLAEGQWEELRRFAHQAKGAAGSYGFSAVSPVAGAVEDAIRAGEPEDQIRQAVEHLCRICRRIRAGVPT